MSDDSSIDTANNSNNIGNAINDMFVKMLAGIMNERDGDRNFNPQQQVGPSLSPPRIGPHQAQTIGGATTPPRIGLVPISFEDMVNRIDHMG